VIPVGDSNRIRSTPWVTRLIILANVVLFLYMFTLPSDPDVVGTNRRGQDLAEVFRDIPNCYGLETFDTEADRFICKYAFQPKEFFDTVSGDSGLNGEERRSALLAIIASMFMHGGWLHIIGNMLFLWVFGDNIEDRLGHAVFFLFYLLAGMVAAFIQGMIDPQSVVPILGASGAVAGVLGAYLVWFPGATIRVVIPFFILIFIPIPIPAWIMIGVWFLQNLLAGYATIADAAAPGQSVAWFAHIGGFLFGILIAALAGSRPHRGAHDRHFERS
jgi:membrane associated rhomboid family serine protease